MTTYTISGVNLQEVAKSEIYDYFKVFGALSDHIVRLKQNLPSLVEDNEPASYSIHFRSLACEEHFLLSAVHLVSGIEVSCARRETDCPISDRKVFIKYLDKKATADDIREAMMHYGEVEAVHISMKKDKSMNLGLGNVLFKHKDSVEKVLNDPSVIIRNKKVKVEAFKCSTSSSKPASLYNSCSLRSRGDDNFQSRTEPVLQYKTCTPKNSKFSPYSILAAKSKTAFSVKDIQSCQDSDFEHSKPFKAAIGPYHNKTGSRDAKDSSNHEVSTKIGEITGPQEENLKSLDFSLIEEECEDSPRPRRGSANFHLHSKGGVLEEMEKSQHAPIISIHGGQAEKVPMDSVKKDSFHSVRPTCKTYYKNPRHHLVPLGKNHRESNLRINRRLKAIHRMPLPGLNVVDRMDVPRFRLF